jgi:hypothetical protein
VRQIMLAEPNVLAESAVIRFTLANGRGSIRMISPDSTQVLQGSVKWTVAADRPPMLKRPPTGQRAAPTHGGSRFRGCYSSWMVG